MAGPCDHGNELFVAMKGKSFEKLKKDFVS
jgi:hypothetical protein